MKVFFSGISGVGIGPLAEIAADAGDQVFGSDVHADPLINSELDSHNIDYRIYNQDGSFLREVYEREGGIDWFVHTSALPPDHPELLLAQELGIKVSKRDGFLSDFIKRHNLKLIAIAGTSGKTTTTAMAVWGLQQLHIPVSYLVGTTLPWAAAGKYDPAAEYFVYECDEFDRNFLAYEPYLSMITSLSYDHAEIYPTFESYYEAFKEFVARSEHCVGWRDDSRGYWEDAPNYVIQDFIDERFTLAGAVNRKDATLVLRSLRLFIPDVDASKLITALNRFPGTGRRFEEIAPNLYSDYAHLPEEIEAMLQKAREVADPLQKKVAVVYEPLQNMRQYNIRSQYAKTFYNADRVLWLPTYQILGREDDRPVLTPEELITNIDDPSKAEPVDLNDNLINKVKELIADNYIVVVASGGKTGDAFFREHANLFA